MNEGNVSFKVLSETFRQTPSLKLEYYKYKAEIISFPYVGRTMIFGRPEGQRLVEGNIYAGKIYHRKMPKDGSYFSGKTYADLDIRRDI